MLVYGRNSTHVPLRAWSGQARIAVRVKVWFAPERAEEVVA